MGMNNFSIDRFGKLVRWSLTMDRRWFVKNTLSWLVVFTLMFLFFTCVARFNDQPASLPAYGACTSMVLFTTRHPRAGADDDVQQHERQAR